MFKFVHGLLSFLSFIIPIQQPPFLSSSSDAAQAVLQSLTLREKIGQLFIVAHRYKRDGMQPNARILGMIKEQRVGGVLFLEIADPASQKEIIDCYQKESRIPLLIAQDGEWGLAMRLNKIPGKVVAYPRAMTLGAIADTKLIYQLGNEIGQQFAALGVGINLAPVVDTNTNPLNPIGSRSFSDNKYAVAQRAAAYAKGLHDAGVLACAKHFPGHGDTVVDSHYDLPCIEKTKHALELGELFPFKKMIADGVSAVMVGHLAVPAFDTRQMPLPATTSAELVTDLLQKQLRFSGLIITDALDMQGIKKCYPEPGQAELESFLAGNDLLVAPCHVEAAIALIERAVLEGKVSRQELDRRVLKILRAKKWLWAKQASSQNIDWERFLVRQEAYDLQRTLFRQAITLVHNKGTIIFSDRMMAQAALFAYGAMPENRFFDLCNILVKHAIQIDQSTADTELKLLADESIETVIIALGHLNNKRLENYGITCASLDLIEQAKKQGKKVIVILFGTPYAMPLVKNADALIVAYEDLPVAQEAAVDCLQGILLPTGRLPIKITGV